MRWTGYSNEQTYWEHIVTTFHLNGRKFYTQKKIWHLSHAQGGVCARVVCVLTSDMLWVHSQGVLVKAAEK